MKTKTLNLAVEPACAKGDLIKILSNVSDEEITREFMHTNFGRTDHRRLLEQSAFQKLVGYHCGYTITRIMQNLGLIGKNETPTKKCRRFVAHAFVDQMQEGGK